MTAMLRVLRAGPACTVQDAGRHGWLRYGVTPAGPMDWIGHAAASLLAGNPEGGAALEIGPGGLDLTAEDGCIRLGLSAPGFAVTRDAAPLPCRAALTLHPGQILSIRPAASHVWAYLAAAGGFDLTPVMGSLSTHLRSGIGPLDGGAVLAGTALPCSAAPEGADLGLPEAAPPRDTLRFVPGPQQDAFTEAGFAAFCAGPYRLTPRSDRMGYRLEGPAIAHARGHDIVSDGIALGAIQVPGDGQPIILMADRQPTGGYPKIGTVIRADLPALAQSRPGRVLRFRPVTVDEAVAALRAALAEVRALAGALRPLSSGLDLEKLATGDHASGFIDARGPA